MKKNLKLAISLVWFLAVQLNFISVSEAQVATRPRGDLLGENTADEIAFNWAYRDGAKEIERNYTKKVFVQF